MRGLLISCEKELYDDDSTGKILKVRDHCHFTGKYRGAAHNFGHLQCRKPMILVQSYFTVFRVMTNICLSNDLPNSKVDWHVIQQLPGGGGGYSGTQVTGMIEWSQKLRPKKIPRASSKTPKNLWTKNWPPKYPMPILWPLKVPERGNAITQRKTLEIEHSYVFIYPSYHLNISFPSSASF